MTDCTNGAVRDLLPDLLHDRLQADERRAAEAHVDACEACRAELALLRDIRSAMHRAPMVDADAIAAAIPAYRALGRPSWIGWRAAAAVALVVGGATSVALFRYEERSTERARSVRVERAIGAPVSTAPAAQPAVGVATPIESALTSRSTPSGLHGGRTPGRELAVTAGVIVELSEAELSALLREIESLDAVPSIEVDNSAAVSPVAPPAAKETDR